MLESPVLESCRERVPEDSATEATMVRRNIKIKRIENATARQVTFAKRRSGLIKKAHDLSVLCDAEVAVIIFSNKGKLFQFASTSMQTVLERLRMARGDSQTVDNYGSPEGSENDRLAHFTEKLKALQSNVIGENLERLCLKEVILLEQQIHESLGQIRARKEELIVDELEELKQKVAEARRTTTVNSSFLDKLIDLCSSDVSTCCQELGAQGDSALETDASPDVGVGTSNHSNCIQDCLPPAKRVRLAEDLNQSPVNDESTEDLCILGLKHN